MKGFFVLLLGVGVGVVLGRSVNVVPSSSQAAGGQRGGETNCAAENGDVNGDGGVDVSDAITILNHLFLASPKALVPLCDPPELQELSAEIQELQSLLAECRAGQCPPSGLPDTGQSTCYDFFGKVVDCESETCSGQDGFYATGCPSQGRFVDNGDGTVTDNCTGLMWQKETGNDGEILNWRPALAYCEDLELAGHDDWRLPNVRELQSIVDYERNEPAIDPVFEVRGESSIPFAYWSSTSVAWGPIQAWVVTFGAGSVFSGEIKQRFFNIRAVRGGS